MRTRLLRNFAGFEEIGEHFTVLAGGLLDAVEGFLTVVDITFEAS